MPRQTFRYDPKQKKMVEVIRGTEFDSAAVHNDIKPFLHNGVEIKSRSHLRAYMGQHDLVPIEAVAARPRGPDPVQRQELREMLWEGISKTYSLGNKPRDRSRR